MKLMSFDSDALRKFDFVDFGTGSGGSLDYSAKRFGGVGIGIDNDENKVRTAQSLGRNVCLADITALPREKLVTYVSMMDFLEHLPSEEEAIEMIGIACALASDFVFIAHPSFEDESYLRTLGLKQYWHDWRGHPTHLLLSEIISALRRNGAQSVEIEFVEATNNSASPNILPISAPLDSHKFDRESHGHKDSIEFDRPVYRQIRIVGRLGNNVS